MTATVTEPTTDLPTTTIRVAAARPWLLAWLAFLPFVVLRAGDLAEADTFWQVRTDLLTISNLAIPATDSFSWTMHGRAWTLNSWAFNVVIALAYRLAGLAGVAWACAGLAMVVAALVLTLARMLGASPALAGMSLFLGAPLLIGWLTARPQLTDYIAFMVLVMLLRRIATGRRPFGSVAWAAGTCAIWVNLHAAALLGAAVAAACAVLLLLRRGTAGGSGGSPPAASTAGVPGSPPPGPPQRGVPGSPPPGPAHPLARDCGAPPPRRRRWRAHSPTRTGSV